nr:MAG TPA: hypothetical protein [Caudoviricetes sp.]
MRTFWCFIDHITGIKTIKILLISISYVVKHQICTFGTLQY